MAGSLASINIKFFADLKQFSTQMQSATRSMKKMGKEITAVGKGLTLGVTAPLLLMGAASLKAFDTQAKAIAQVEAGLKSTGAAVGYTSAQLQQMASDLQNKTIFGDEEILKDATAQLLTFTNIAGDQFARTQVAVLDLATRLDGDLKSASIQLGKALNDPVANLSALSRSGIQFSKEQKAVINSLVATNRLADAQTIILDELAKQYGGSAEAAAKAGLGGMKQLSNIIGDLSEDFGKIISEAIAPFIVKIKGLVLAFKDLPESTKKTIVGIAALAAVVGPLLVTLGFMMTTVVPGLIVAFGFLKAAVIATSSAFGTLNTFMLANPVVAIAAGIAAITYGLIELVQSITPAVSKLKTLFNLIRSGADPIRFTSLQIADQMEEMAKQDIAAKAAAAATKAFNDKQKEAAASTAKLTGEIIKQAVVAGGGEKVKTGKQVNSLNVTTSGVDQGFLKIPKKLAIANQGIQTQLESGKVLFTDFQYQANEIINSTAENFAIGFGELIGNIALGNVGIGGVFQLMLGTIADMLVSLGKMAITTGTVVEAIKKALSSLNGFVAIAAGVAAIALGTFIKGKISGLGKSNSNSYADGGIVGGNSFYGDKLMAFLNSGETVLNRDQQKTLYNAIQPAGQNVNVGLNGEFRLNGQDLLLVVDRATTRKNRTS